MKNQRLINKQYLVKLLHTAMIVLGFIVCSGTCTTIEQAEIKPEAKLTVTDYDEYAEQRNAAAKARH